MSEENPNDLEVKIEGEPAPYLGRQNLMNGAIQNRFPEPAREIFKSLVSQARSVNIKVIRAPTYDHPRLHKYAD